MSAVTMVLPPEMKDGPLWILRRIKSGEVRGYKAGRTWRMTHEDVEDLIASHRNAPAPPEPEPDLGLSFTATSRRRLLAQRESPPQGITARSRKLRQGK